MGKGLWQRGEGSRKLVCKVKEGKLEGQKREMERHSRKEHGEEGPQNVRRKGMRLSSC